MLALESESFCYLETTAETVGFFTKVLRLDDSISCASESSGCGDAADRVIMRLHFGTVYDISISWSNVVNIVLLANR